MTIVVLGLRRWGQLGNLNAAKRLGHIVRRVLNEPCAVLAADDACPTLRCIGLDIQSATAAAGSPQELAAAYDALIRTMVAAYPAGFETGGSWTRAAREDADRLADALRPLRPKLVIACKGVVARLVIAALHSHCPMPPVVNFITNPGLLDLAVHRAPAVAHTIVPFPSTKARLVGGLGLDCDSVTVVGVLLPSHGSGLDQDCDLLRWCRSHGEQLPIVLIANGLRRIYLDLIVQWRKARLERPLALVAVRDGALEREARERLRASRLPWCVLPEQSAPALMASMTYLRSCPGSFVVTKSGPGTVLQGLRTGIPLLIHWSGLPMERWVVEYLGATDAAAGCWNEDTLCETFARWTADASLPAALVAPDTSIPPFDEAGLAHCLASLGCSA